MRLHGHAEVPRRRARPPAGDRRAPRRQLHRLSRQPALPPAAGDPSCRRGDRPAQDLGPSASTEAFNPKRAGAPNSVSVSATLSQTATWQVAVRNPDSNVVRSYNGSGTQVAATWDGRDSSGALVPDGSYTLVVTASSSAGAAHPATLPVDVLTVPPTISDLRGGVVSPNGDGIEDLTKLSYVVSRPCQAEVGHHRCHRQASARGAGLGACYSRRSRHVLGRQASKRHAHDAGRRWHLHIHCLHGRRRRRTPPRPAAR